MCSAVRMVRWSEEVHRRALTGLPSAVAQMFFGTHSPSRCEYSSPAEESGGLLAEFVDYIAEKKVVVLEELAAEFGLRTQDAVSRVQALEQMGRITGVMDDRGKFIFISRDEMAEVAAFINRKGRVAIAELARKSSDFVKL